MFCKNCGANLPDGATFCGSCGSKQDVPVQSSAAPMGGYNQQPQAQPQQQSQPQPQVQAPGFSAQLNLNNLSFAGISGMRLIAVIAMALVAIFSITKYMYMEVEMLGQSVDRSFNFMQIFGGDMLEGDLTTGYKVIMYMILFTNIVALAGCAGFLAFSFIGGPAANNPMAIQKCILCATGVLVALAVGLILCFICPSPIPNEAAEFMGNSYDISVGYGFAGWLSIIVVAAVRFYLLPICMKEVTR